MRGNNFPRSSIVRPSDLHFDTRLEYTIEKGRVFILQIRKDRERKERVAALEKTGYQVIARGTGVSGKIFRGIMVTDRNPDSSVPSH